MSREHFCLNPRKMEAVKMTTRRRRFKQTSSLQDRLSAFANEARERATHLPPSSERHHLLEKAREADTTARMDRWINSPGLQPPE